MKICRFPNVSSNQPLPSINENSAKPKSRPQRSSHSQSTADSQSKSSRVFPTNLESIDEEINPKPIVPQPTTVDAKHDIQILTLNDDGNNHEEQDEVPF